MSANTQYPRINKHLAELGVCSRREAEELILNGWVRVNSQTVRDLSYRVQPQDKVTLAREAESHLSKKATLIINKPVGYVSAQPEDGHPPAIELVKKANYSGPGQVPRLSLKGMAPVGRLDIDSKGLLILTQDGKLARQVIGENSNIEKEYLVRVQGEVTPGKLKKLQWGLSLDGKKLKKAKVQQMAPQLLQFILTEGKKRQIRRMCELVGLEVTSLKRVRIGALKLGNLKEGQWRLMKKSESVVPNSKRDNKRS